jgi:hypothetical protein
MRQKLHPEVQSHKTRVVEIQPGLPACFDPSASLSLIFSEFVVPVLTPDVISQSVKLPLQLDKAIEAG